MKKCQSISRLIGTALLVAIAATAANAPPLTFTFTKDSVPGALQTNPGGINNAGVSVGLYQDKSKVFHGYILNGTKVTTLDDPKALKGTTSASNLNPNSPMLVVGVYSKSATATVGFLYKGGKFTDITGPKGATSASANGINDAGHIVGNYTDSKKVTHGFLLKGTTYKTLDPPGSVATVATGIDKNDIIVLYWVDSKGLLESSIYNGTTYKTINVPTATQSAALDNNSEGDVVYQWFDSSKPSKFHGALFHAGKYYKFDFPKAVQTYGGGLNDKNMLVGGYQIGSTTGPFQGFKASFK